MFDLDREVAAWSRAVHEERCQPAAVVAELSDHLYCEIERARATGLSDEAAFRAATARLGTARQLTAEHAKNRSALGTACQMAARLDPAMGRPEQRWLLLAHAAVWAALIIATTLALKKAAPAEVSVWLLTVIFVSLWWASEQLLRLALRQKREAR